MAAVSNASGADYHTRPTQPFLVRPNEPVSAPTPTAKPTKRIWITQTETTDAPRVRGGTNGLYVVIEVQPPKTRPTSREPSAEPKPSLLATPNTEPITQTTNGAKVNERHSEQEGLATTDYTTINPSGSATRRPKTTRPARDKPSNKRQLIAHHARKRNPLLDT